MTCGVKGCKAATKAEPKKTAKKATTKKEKTTKK
jgi:hypothetical protein